MDCCELKMESEIDFQKENGKFQQLNGIEFIKYRITLILSDFRILYLYFVFKIVLNWK